MERGCRPNSALWKLCLFIAISWISLLPDQFTWNITHLFHFLKFEMEKKIILFLYLFKGCGMGPWLVFVSPCFRENVVATCKIGSFLCSLDNLLQKNVIVLFFGNQISKWRSFKKIAIFDLLFTFYSHQGKLQKILQHISHSHTYTYFAHPIDFFALPI